ncbi:MAG: hypothetical protein IPL22_07770 [Bacteroidetes bacterium]|nr:hypothetical protein [Bacteroidota bacterium]
MKIYLRVVLFLLLAANISISNAQVVFQHVDYSQIYDYLDEMANMKVIELNSAVKPYTRIFIANKLSEIGNKKETLNKRQQEEWKFFMREYSKELDATSQTDFLTKKMFGSNRIKFKEREKRVDLFYFRDSTFMFTLNPILGAQFWNNDSGNVYHRWNGAEMMFYAGKHLGVYANLRDNYMSKAITGPDFLTQQTGGGFKNPTYGFTNRDAVEYSEMRGGITFNGKWGYIGLIKDHNVWGNNYNGANILSSRAPSFAQIRLQVKPSKWLELNYFHVWLSSKVVDTAATQFYGTGTTTAYVPKYMAANFITVKPVKNLHFSIGNSIIYSQDFNAGFLIPFIFYKSLDHTYSTLGNSQLFVDLSVRNLKHCHFYVTGFFDDISFGRLFEANALNPWSIKAGTRISNIIKNVSLTAEYTRNNVLAYKHFNPETTFETTKYNMGHYLRDNAQDLFLMVSFKPIARLSVDLIYNYSNKGPDYPDDRNAIDPVTGLDVIFTYPFQEKLIWEKTAYAFQAQYDILNDFTIRAKVEMADVKDENGVYTHSMFQGDQMTTSLLLTVGF